MWIVAATIAITPLFLGGNRPLVWPIVLAILSITLVFNAAVLVKIKTDAAVSLNQFKLELSLLSLFLAFAVFQILPLGIFGNLRDFGLPDGQTLSVAPTESILALITWLNVLIVAYLALQFSRNEQRSLEFLSILFWIVVLHAALGFVLFQEFEDSTLIGPKWAYLGSMTGAFVNRNTFATFLASGAVLGAGLILRDIRSAGGSLFAGSTITKLAFRGLGLLLILAVLVGTGSRMGLFVGMFGLLLLILLVMPKQIGTGSVALKLLSVVLPMIALSLVVLWGYGGLTVERLGSVDRDVDVRLELYRQTWAMIMNRPWTGFGGGSYELAFHLFHQPGVSVDLLWQKAHNSYLGLWADYGLVVGTLPWLVLLLIAGRLLRVFWSRNSPDFVASSAIVVVVIAMVHAFVDFSLEIQGYALLFAAIIGAGAARIGAGARQAS
jgi:O-antigen ligase